MICALLEKPCQASLPVQVQSLWGFRSRAGPSRFRLPVHLALALGTCEIDFGTLAAAAREA